MNILFLDVDGVLNSRLFLQDKFYKLKRRLEKEESIDPYCMDLLKDIVNKYEFKIVLISSRNARDLYSLKSVFKDYGLIISGTTRKLGRRSEEISDWISTHRVTNYIILDDDLFPEYIQDKTIFNHLIQTNFNDYHGINLNVYDRIEKILEEAAC